MLQLQRLPVPQSVLGHWAEFVRLMRANPSLIPWEHLNEPLGIEWTAFIAGVEALEPFHP